MHIKIKRLTDSAITPTYGTDGAACFDLYAAESKQYHIGRAIVDTGIALEVPEGFALFVKPRSGLAFKHEIHAFAGTVDSDYRDSVKVLLMHEWAGETISILKGERVAQAFILPVPRIEFVEAEELGVTARGVNGFGSTGR